LINPILRISFKSGTLTLVRNAGMAFLLVSSTVSVSVADSIFGVYVGASVWDPDVGGSVGQNTNAFDLSGEFEDSSADSSTVYVAVEHPVPVLPNIRVSRTPISWTGSADDATGILGGFIPLEGEIDAEIDLDMSDLTLYYQVLDNFVGLDIGVTARLLDGFVEATDVTVNSLTADVDRIDIDVVIPMLYASARFDLPFSGLAVGVRGNAIAFEGSSLTDLEAFVHIEFDLLPFVDFGIQGGFRRLTLDIDDIDDFNSDVTIDGAFVGLTGHF